MGGYVARVLLAGSGFGEDALDGNTQSLGIKALLRERPCLARFA
jgi:hypothetical protein